jgi:hypothetical protein
MAEIRRAESASPCFAPISRTRRYFPILALGRVAERIDLLPFPRIMQSSSVYTRDSMRGSAKPVGGGVQWSQ